MNNGVPERGRRSRPSEGGLLSLVSESRFARVFYNITMVMFGAALFCFIWNYLLPNRCMVYYCHFIFHKRTKIHRH